MKNKTIELAFDTLANIAGGVITENEFVSTNTTQAQKTHLCHKPKDFYCVSVPGKAFYVKSNDKISVTGNSIHVESLIKLFRAYIKEQPKIWNDKLKGEIYDAAQIIVDQEDAFIDLCFEMGGIQGLEPADVKKYIRYIADRRLIAMGMKGIFKHKKNPLDWLDHILNGVEFSNFFEVRSTEYSKSATLGTWDDVWKQFDQQQSKQLVV